MKTYCNPLDLGYRYQHMKEGERIAGFREGADPTLVYFKGRYYLFVSMSAGFWYSDDLLHWDFHADPDLLIYDYAPRCAPSRRVSLFFCQPQGAQLPDFTHGGPADRAVYRGQRSVRLLGPGYVLGR